MPTRTFESLVEKVVPSVLGCPEPTVVNYIRDAAIRTCERSLYWRYAAAAVELTEDEHEYAFVTPTDTEVHVIFEAMLDDYPLQRLTLEQMLGKYPAWEGNTGTPQAISQLTPDEYVVLPTPDDGGPYEIRLFLALKPTRDATDMEEYIFNELEEAILHSALQHLLVMPNVSWTDRELAAYHAKQFLFQVNERRARANLGNARGNLTARMQPFG